MSNKVCGVEYLILVVRRLQWTRAHLARHARRRISVVSPGAGLDGPATGPVARGLVPGGALLAGQSGVAPGADALFN